jgi:serine protease
MIHKQSFFALAAMAGFVGAAFAGVPQYQSPTVQPSGETDRLIVKYKDASPATKGAAHVPPIGDRIAHVDRAGRQFGLQMRALRTTATGAHVLQINKRITRAEAEALARELASRDATVAYAEPDLIMEKMGTPNDTYYSYQWHYFDAVGGMRADLAWDKSIGTGVTVAVIDTGYRPHVDLAANLLPGYDFISTLSIANDGDLRDSDASDPGDAVVAGECGMGKPISDQSSSWHGTHVSGTIAAVTNNGLGMAGVAYGAKVVPVRVLGKCGGYTSDIADGIIWASGGTVSGVPANANPAKVLNMSLGGSGSCSTTTQSAINTARSRGSVVIVAAGNSNVNASNANPANCAGVVTIAATTKSGGRASYSNYGTVVDLAAPGGDSSGYVWSTLNSGTTVPLADNYAGYQGTSMATPHVAGVAALMLSKNPALTPDEIENKLKATARAFPATCSGCGTGILDANAAVDAAFGVTPTPTTTIAEVETNNTTGRAQAITASDTTVNGTISKSNDLDYYVVQLPAGKTLSATLTMSNTTNDYDLNAYNSSGALVAASSNGPGASDAVSVQNTGTATLPVYVRVNYMSGATGATNGKYTLKLIW